MRRRRCNAGMPSAEGGQALVQSKHKSNSKAMKEARSLKGAIGRLSTLRRKLRTAKERVSALEKIKNHAEERYKEVKVAYRRLRYESLKNGSHVWSHSKRHVDEAGRARDQAEKEYTKAMASLPALEEQTKAAAETVTALKENYAAKK